MSKSTTLDMALARSATGLREFGYLDVKTEMIREIHTAWLKGEEPPHGVIGMFAVQNFKDYPDLFGKPKEG